MPTNWLRAEGQNLLSDHQVKKLTEKLALRHPAFDGPTTVSKGAWYPLTREIYSVVRAAGRSESIDSFNRTYGLLRGIAAALILSTFAAVFLLESDEWVVVTLLAAASLMASYRMYRFGIHYARELFVQYISL